MRMLLNHPDSKYRGRLSALGLRHGKDYDCMRPNCITCNPWRQEEKEKWDAMSEEERKKVHFGRIG